MSEPINKKSQKDSLKTLKILWEGHDEIELTFNSDLKVTSLKVNACIETTTKFQALSKVYKNRPLTEWKLPPGHSHSDMLIREIVLKAIGKWDAPYKEEELCHCRLVTTKSVDQAILSGAHTAIQVMLKTGAGSACGNCQMNTNCMIKYRLGSG